MLRLMKAFLNWISRLYPLVVLPHDFPENVSRWAAPKYKMSRTTQQIFPLIQQWGVGRGMSFRKDTVSGDIFLHFVFFTSFKSIFWHRIHVRDTLGTRDFFSRVTWSFVGRRHVFGLRPKTRAAKPLDLTWTWPKPETAHEKSLAPRVH